MATQIRQAFRLTLDLLFLVFFILVFLFVFSNPNFQIGVDLFIFVRLVVVVVFVAFLTTNGKIISNKLFKIFFNFYYPSLNKSSLFLKSQ